MTEKELKELALYFVEVKGCTDRDKIWYADDLYEATSDEKEKCLDFVDDIVDCGIELFRMNMV